MIQKKWISVFVAMLLTISLVTVSSTASAQGANDVTSQMKYAGSYYQDEPLAVYNLLGAAQNFHIFAREVAIKAHTNGNIATQLLTQAGSNFGTNIKSANSEKAREVFYIQSFKDMTSNPYVGDRPTKFVVGSQVKLSENNGQEFYLTDGSVSKKIDSLKSNTVYSTVYREQDSSTPYIDFDKEFNYLYKKSAALSLKKSGVTVILEKGRITMLPLKRFNQMAVSRACPSIGMSITIRGILQLKQVQLLLIWLIKINVS